MKKIIFFDWWEKGFHHFIPLHRRLTELGYECHLVHYGRWYDPHAVVEQRIEGLLCREIAHYGGRFARALEAEQPDLVMVLNSGATIDRMVNRSCRALGIPTIYLMHGIKAIGADLEEFIQQQNAHWGIRRRLAKIPKYVGVSLEYLSSIARDNPVELLAPATYGHFIQLAIEPGAVRERPWPHKDVYCDRALVYANVYRDSLVREASYPPDRVKVVGNPNLDPALRIAQDSAAQAQAVRQLADLGVRPGRRAVVYMEDSFVEQGIGHWTEASRLDEMRQVARCAIDADLDLIIKMHPGSDPTATVKEFAGASNVHVALKADLAGLVWACSATIGHISTTLMLPIVLDRPLIVPTWSPGLERLGYYVAAGAAVPAKSPEDLTRMLLDPERARVAIAPLLARFVNDYVTYTDGRGWERVVSSIIECASP